MGEGGGEGHAEATFAAFLTDMSPRAIAFLIKKDGTSETRALATLMLKAADLPQNIRSGLTLALTPTDAARLTAEEQSRLTAAGTDAAKLSTLIANAKIAPNLREAALTALIKTDAPQSARFFATLINATTDEPALTALLSALLPADAANKALITTLKEKPCSADAAKRVLSVITRTGRSEPELSAVLTSIIGAKNTVPSYDPAWVATLANEVKTSGDATRGSVVFASTLTNCIACHSIAKKGGVIGPELDAVGRGVPMELLIEAVTWPNRQIKEGYLATNVAMKDGRRLQGYKVAELGGELQLRDFLGGRTHTLKAADIATRTDAGSLMPEGLVALMTRDELRDLIAYLATLGK
jgi:putative heme-binding domain-containing protein